MRKYLGYGDVPMKISVSLPVYQELKKIMDEETYHVGMFSETKTEVGQILETALIEFNQARAKKK